jgi:hypothetical protein
MDDIDNVGWHSPSSRSLHLGIIFLISANVTLDSGRVCATKEVGFDVFNAGMN